MSNRKEQEEQDELVFEPSSEFTLDSSNQTELEGQLIKIIKSFKGKEYKDGVPWHELMVKADSEGIDKNIIEDLVNGLLNNGKIYEPMLGRVKCTNN